MKVTNRRFSLLIAAVVMVAAALLVGGVHSRAFADPNSPQAPDPWSSPVNVSNSGARSNYPAVAGKPDGSAGLVWTEADAEDEDPSYEYGTFNTVPGGTFNGNNRELQRGGKKGTGNSVATHDSLGRLNAAWYTQPSNGSSFITFGRFENGQWTVHPIDQTRINGYKELAIASGPNGRTHLIFGRHQNALYYTFTDDGVNWAPLNNVGVGSARETLGIGVSSLGQVMVLYVDLNNDQQIMAKFLQPNGSWSGAQQVSGGGAENRHFPSVAADANGGFRVAWDQGNPAWDAGDGVHTTDIFYREWTPTGGWTPYIVQISNNQGDSSKPTVTVDGQGFSYVVWSDWSSRGRGNFSIYARAGEGPDFGDTVWLIPEWGTDSYAKDPSADLNGDRLHVAFDSNRTGSPKDIFYMSRPVVPDNSTPTNTPTITGTPTPLATNTPIPRCAGERFYMDTCPGDYYYSDVMALVRIGAISGYNDGTFRPFNPVTRGQAAKVLALAIGLVAQDPNAAHFKDVNDDNAFYPWVEAAYQNGVISGYDGADVCGSVALTPCFKPNNPVTRGQLAKMIALARDWPLVNPDNPTFRDVPNGNAFYTYVETAAAYGIITGVNCGSAGEPCPGQYFRPFATATRAQAAKIINTGRLFFPTATATPTGTSTPTLTPTVTATATPARPVLDSFSPNRVNQGDTQTQVTLTGQDFGADAGTVVINGVKATIVSWTNTQIVFRVGEGTPGNLSNTTVRVLAASGLYSDSAPNQFAVVPPGPTATATATRTSTPEATATATITSSPTATVTVTVTTTATATATATEPPR